MIMKDGVRIGMAVGLGYLLGRTRKGRLALMLVGVGATGRFGKGPAALVKQGVDVLGSSPEVKTLTETARGRLVEAGKAAAVSAVSNRVGTLTGKIEERTGTLTSAPLGGQAEQTDDDTDTDTSEDEREEQGEGEEGDDEKAAERRPQRTTTRRPGRSESADEPEDEDPAADRPRRPARPSGRRPPVRRTRRREQ
jgi:hypothetical protein